MQILSLRFVPISRKFGKVGKPKINCTGPDTQLKESKNKLYKNLIKKGYIRNSENGIGFKTLSGGRILGKDEKSVENIYALGPLRKNELWESTALREIRAQVDELVENIQKIAKKEYKIK